MCNILYSMADNNLERYLTADVRELWKSATTKDPNVHTQVYIDMQGDGEGLVSRGLIWNPDGSAVSNNNTDPVSRSPYTPKTFVSSFISLVFVFKMFVIVHYF